MTETLQIYSSVKRVKAIGARQVRMVQERSTKKILSVKMGH